MRRQISFYASTRSYHPVLELHGWKDVGNQLFDMSTKGEWDAMPKLITDGMLEQFCTIGTYDEIVQKLLKHYGGLTSRSGFAIPARTPEEEQRLTSMIRELQAA